MLTISATQCGKSDSNKEGSDLPLHHNLPDTLRVATLYSPASFFIYKGAPMGYEYERVQTAWLYSEFGKNFCKTMMNLTATKPQLKVVFDQVGTPTYALDLAKAIAVVIEKFDGSQIGIYHYSNEGVCSWFDFTKMIAEYNGTIECDVQPCHSDEFPSPVKRPSYSVLDKTKIKEVFGVTIPYWTDSLKKCISNLKNQ